MHPWKRSRKAIRHIDLEREDEKRAWAKRFGVTADELQRAVSDVGDRVDRVEAHLRRHRDDDARSEPRVNPADKEER